MKTPFIFILLGTILFLNACIKTTHVSNPTVHSGLPVSQESFIQLIHASPGTPGIKLWQNQKTFQTVGNYYKSNTQYFPIQSGETALEIKRSSNGLLLATIPASLKAGQYYSLFACDSPSRFTPVLISDNPQPLKEDKTQIRLVNIMSSGEPIDYF